MKAALAFALGLGAYFALRGFGEEPARVGGVFAFTVVLWASEALPLAVSALLSSALLVVFTDMDEKAVFAAYGHPIIPLFIGSFVLAKAMEVTRLSDRVALSLLKRPWAHKSPSALLFWLGAVACGLSLLVSNTAVTAMLLPVGMAILASVQKGGAGGRYSIGLLLMLTWGSSVAVGFPVGTPPNLIGIAALEQVGTKISFLQWATFAMPITALLLAASWAILWLRYGRGAPETESAGQTASNELVELGPMRSSEKVVIGGFALAMLLWIAPDSLELALGKTNPLAAWMDKHVTEALAALAGMAVLFLVPAKGEPQERAISWREATSIEWGTILLFGGGIALGEAMFKSGLAKKLGEAAAQASGASDVWAITALMIVAAIALSELASNTSAATTLVPVAVGLAQGAGVSPVAPALGAAIGASVGFMLPVSTPPNAIVHSTGLVPGKEMLVSGILLDLLGGVAIFVCLRFILPLMGLA